MNCELCLEFSCSWSVNEETVERKGGGRLGAVGEATDGDVHASSRTALLLSRSSAAGGATARSARSTARSRLVAKFTAGRLPL